MDPELLNRIKKDLPNFPDAVITDWVAPHMRRWPPQVVNNCGPVMLFKSLDFWKNVTWQDEIVDIGRILFAPSTMEAFEAVWGGLRFDYENPCSVFDSDITEHFRTLLTFLFANGLMPSPVCLLRQGDSVLVGDGHHRILAWQAAAHICRQLESLGQSSSTEFFDLLRARWGVETNHFRDIPQHAWVATHD